MAQPKVSIVTISLNNRAGVLKTLESVSSQDYPDIEHVIVDGGSRDDTARHVARFTRSHPRHSILFLSEPDRGISHAFNKGLALSTGDWVNFLNSGDVFLRPDAVSVFSRCFPSAPVVTAFARFGEKRIPKRVLSDSTPLHKRVWVAHQATFVRRDVFGTVGAFSERLKLRMDYDFFFRALRAASMTFIDAELVDYEPGGLSGRNLRLFYQEECLVKSLRLFPSFPHVAASAAKYLAKTVLKAAGKSAPA